MAKLYWRLKVNGKWTWKPVKVLGQSPLQQVIDELVQYNQIELPEEEE